MGTSHTFLPSEAGEIHRHLFGDGFGPKGGGGILRAWGGPTTHTLGWEL